MSIISYVTKTLVDFFTRRRSIGLNLIRLGVPILMLVLAGVALKVSIPTINGPLSISFSSEGGPGAIVGYVALAIGTFLVCAGFMQLRSENAVAARKRVFVIELRGLRDWNGPPLSASVPRHVEGRRDDVILDLRQKVQDGVIVDPEVAIERLSSLRTDLDTREIGLDRQNVRHVFGGLAPVPLTFLVGVLVDDETPIGILDWDRQQRVWRELDDKDDGERFSVLGLDTVTTGTQAVILLVSASYRVNTVAAQERFSGLPLIELRFDEPSTTRHWSEDKQQALSQQFIGVCQRLEAFGVRTVHLFLAGPSSLVFRFGSHYDKRNLPNLIVYQYEQQAVPAFPWGVQMPVAGNSKAAVVY